MKKHNSEQEKGHDKSIRKRLTGTVLIPSITLIVMWTAVSSYFVLNAVYVNAVMDGVKQVSIPAVTGLASAQKERQLSVSYLEGPGAGLAELQAQQQETDQDLESLREPIKTTIANTPEPIAKSLTEFMGNIDQLRIIRAQVIARTINKAQVIEYYNQLLDKAANVFELQARIVPEVTTSQGGSAATAIFRAGDKLSRANTLVSSYYATQQFSSDDYLLFSQLVGSYRADLARTGPFLHPDVQDQYRALMSSDAWNRLVADENAIIKQGPSAGQGRTVFPVSEGEWRQVTNEVFTDLIDLTIAHSNAVAGQSLDESSKNLTITIVGSLVALLASIISIIVAMRVSRTLVDRALMTRLERLRKDSLELARTRLPSIVRRLKDGESVDVNAELPRLDHGKDEIGEVAEAFNIAQLTAVSAAVSEAKARSGVHNVFLGIAHRNQGLVHRQLQILDEMESREEDPNQLKGLFQLDHLATRARRTTENLIILGGKQPGRRWRKPVWLMDVLRAAVSETEQYSRVHMEHIPEVAVIGSAVADTIHLIAELVDNATAFSPPGSQVHVSSTLVARGVVVDVADQGLGMKDEVRSWANKMMSEPPEFDAMALKADSSLGLFVVARLGARLGIKVTFDSSRYGGTRATVLIPTAVLAADEQVGEDDGPGFRHLQQASDTQASVTQASPRREKHRLLPEPHDVGRTEHNRRVKEQSSRSTEVETVMSGGSGSSGDLQPPVWPSATPQESTRQPVTPQASPPQAGVETAQGHQGTAQGTARRARTALPQRQPQQNIVPQLLDDPNAENGDYEQFSSRTRSTLSAFHKGSRRGREEDGSVGS